MNLSTDLAHFLEPIANQFSQIGVPTPIVHWGHPFFMSIVIFVMGTVAAVTGWRGRIESDPDTKVKRFTDHRKVAPLMSVFLAMGYTGGLLSLVMQKQPLLESPHFWTGSLVLTLLALNGSLSLSGFGGNQPVLRSAHAYIGTATVALLLFHAFLGVRLGLSI